MRFSTTLFQGNCGSEQRYPANFWLQKEKLIVQCLSAGSNIIDHEAESDLIRPLAKEVTKQLDLLRDLLKNQSLRDPSAYNPVIKENLLKFDKLFAEFEYQWVHVQWK